jgi:hypothetical protein
VSESTLFVVRVWRQWASFRASVRRVDDEDTRFFEQASDVARYLETSAVPAGKPAVERVDAASPGTGLDISPASRDECGEER